MVVRHGQGPSGRRPGSRPSGRGRFKRGHADFEPKPEEPTEEAKRKRQEAAENVKKQPALMREHLGEEHHATLDRLERQHGEFLQSSFKLRKGLPELIINHNELYVNDPGFAENELRWEVRRDPGHKVVLVKDIGMYEENLPHGHGKKIRLVGGEPIMSDTAGVIEHQFGSEHEAREGFKKFVGVVLKDLPKPKKL